MTDAATLDKAVAKHARWKYHLRQAVNTGESQWTVADIEHADRCDFGQWLKSLPITDKHSDHWKKVNKLHAEFHKATAEILELALSGRQADAAEKMSLGSQFATTSSQLTLAMTAWKKSLSADG